MKLCLLFHCLCESYNEVPEHGKELFVSVADMRAMVEQLLERGYTFSSPEDTAPDTVTITFDDGYYNNLLFGELSHTYNIPYLIFVSAYYALTGEAYPWLAGNGQNYAKIRELDFYKHYSAGTAGGQVCTDSGVRPMTLEELTTLRDDGQVEIGCHGYYHQALSSRFERYLPQERDLAMSALKERLGLSPRYYALANGLYTRQGVRKLLETFDRVFTIEGRPFRPRDRVIHRLSLINPNVAGPLVGQIGRHLGTLRQIKRAMRTTRRLRMPWPGVRAGLGK